MPALFRKLRDENYVPQIWASQWFLTFFAAYFPVEITSRIWDIYLVEGRKTIFRFALAILKINEAALLKADLEGLFTILKDYGQKADFDKLMEVAFKGFTFSRSLITKYETEHSESPKEAILNLCYLP